MNGININTLRYKVEVIVCRHQQRQAPVSTSKCKVFTELFLIVIYPILGIYMLILFFVLINPMTKKSVNQGYNLFDGISKGNGFSISTFILWLTVLIIGANTTHKGWTNLYSYWTDRKLRTLFNQFFSGNETNSSSTVSVSTLSLSTSSTA